MGSGAGWHCKQVVCVLQQWVLTPFPGAPQGTFSFQWVPCAVHEGKACKRLGNFTYLDIWPPRASHCHTHPFVIHYKFLADFLLGSVGSDSIRPSWANASPYRCPSPDFWSVCPVPSFVWLVKGNLLMWCYASLFFVARVGMMLFPVSKMKLIQ